MASAGPLLCLTGLAGVVADHFQIAVEAPEGDFWSGGLGDGGDQEVDRRPAMVAVGCLRQLALHGEGALDARVLQWHPLQRREQAAETLLIERAVSGRCMASSTTGTQVTISPCS